LEEKKKKKKNKLPSMKTALDTELCMCILRTTDVPTGSHQGTGVTNVCLSPEQLRAGWRMEKPLPRFSSSLANPFTQHAATESNPSGGHW